MNKTFEQEYHQFIGELREKLERLAVSARASKTDQEAIEKANEAFGAIGSILYRARIASYERGEAVGSRSIEHFYHCCRPCFPCRDALQSK